MAENKFDYSANLNTNNNNLSANENLNIQLGGPNTLEAIYKNNTSIGTNGYNHTQFKQTTVLGNTKFEGKSTDITSHHAKFSETKGEYFLGTGSDQTHTEEYSAGSATYGTNANIKIAGKDIYNVDGTTTINKHGITIDNDYNCCGMETSITYNCCMPCNFIGKGIANLGRTIAHTGPSVIGFFSQAGRTIGSCFSRENLNTVVRAAHTVGEAVNEIASALK